MDVKWNVDLHKEFSKREIESLHPIKLAYIGDAIYEVYIRRYVLANYNLRIRDINKMTIDYVKATSQAYIANQLKPLFTEAEGKIFKRGRNSNSNTTPKNTSRIDYKLATGFESVIGYLYLSGEEDRLDEIISKSIEIIERRKIK